MTLKHISLRENAEYFFFQFEQTHSRINHFKWIYFPLDLITYTIARRRIFLGQSNFGAALFHLGTRNHLGRHCSNCQWAPASFRQTFSVYPSWTKGNSGPCRIWPGMSKENLSWNFVVAPQPFLIAAPRSIILPETTSASLWLGSDRIPCRVASHSGNDGICCRQCSKPVGQCRLRLLTVFRGLEWHDNNACTDVFAM